jgi:hypothetical protein
MRNDEIAMIAKKYGKRHRSAGRARYMTCRETFS